MSLLPSNKEVEYHRKNFLESLKLYGVASKFIQLSENHTESYDLYNDLETTRSTTYGEPIDVFVTFEEIPSAKTLKGLGWYTTGDENIPMLAHVPVSYGDVPIKPEKDDILVIGVNEYEPKKFLIKDFVGKGHPNVIHWVCKLVKLDVDVVLDEER